VRRSRTRLCRSSAESERRAATTQRERGNAQRKRGEDNRQQKKDEKGSGSSPSPIRPDLERLRLAAAAAASPAEPGADLLHEGADVLRREVRLDDVADVLGRVEQLRARERRTRSGVSARSRSTRCGDGKGERATHPCARHPARLDVQLHAHAPDVARLGVGRAVLEDEVGRRRPDGVRVVDPEERLVQRRRRVEPARIRSSSQLRA